jgi:hypothetical protein
MTINCKHSENKKNSEIQIQISILREHNAKDQVSTERMEQINIYFIFMVAFAVVWVPSFCRGTVRRG